MVKSYDIGGNHFRVSGMNKSHSFTNCTLRLHQPLIVFVFIVLLCLARVFDYFDNGMMEEVQHRLFQTMSVTNGANEGIIFKGRSIGRRVTANGSVELLVRWTPDDM